MQKRLIKAITNGELADVNVDFNVNDAEHMIPLKSLDSADVKTDTCPECRYSPLSRKDGIKFCKSCGATFKIFNGEVFELI